jgi:hypothetical protein
MKTILTTVALLALCGCASKPKPPVPMACYEEQLFQGKLIERFANERGNNSKDWWEKTAGRCGTLSTLGTESLPWHVYALSQDHSQDFATYSSAMDYLNKWCPVTNTKYVELGPVPVTQAQWEAAQGLYRSSPACNKNEHWKMIPKKDVPSSGDYYSDLGDQDMAWYCEKDGYRSHIRDTFPPSGDAK